MTIGRLSDASLKVLNTKNLHRRRHVPGFGGDKRSSILGNRSKNVRL